MKRHYYRITRHYVTFFFPGAFFSEQATKRIGEWNVDLAIEMANKMDYRPYCFYFSTKSTPYKRTVAKSGMHYFGGAVATYQEVMDRNLADENVLRDNMRWNNYPAVIETRQGARPFYDGDVVLGALVEHPTMAN